VAEQRSPRSGTIPVPLVPQREIPWFKISVVANLVLALGLIVSILTRPSAGGGGGGGRDEITALAETNPEEALGEGAKKLGEAEEAVHYWHEFLGKEFLKAGKKDQAKVQYTWLVKNFPKDAAYKQGLAAANAKGKKPPKKK
jgi:hypothetical protein